MTVSILVVDDEADVAQVFRQQFRREVRDGRYAMHFAASGEDALTQLSNGIEPTLIVIMSDINMPGMDGLTLFGEIKRQFPLNETLLAMRAYAPYHHLYAIEMCFSIANNQSEKVASPSKSYGTAAKAGMVDELVKVAGISLSMALEAAANEPQPANRVFSPQNWVKTKGCLSGINGAICNYFNMLPMMPGGGEIKKKLTGATQLRPEDFEYRWPAD